MGYQLTLEKAGATVLAYKEFGSYQGTWMAFAIYEGKKGIVQGSYGSCSGCDAFQATFDYDPNPSEYEGKYYKGSYPDEDDEITREEYDLLIKAYNDKLANFGAEYLTTGLYTKQHYEQRLVTLKAKEDQDDWFDNEEKEYCEWAVNQNW